MNDNRIVELCRAVSDYPGRVTPRIALADLYGREGRREEARNLLLEGVFYAANSSADLLCLAEAMIRIEALPEAIDCLQAALRADYQNGRAYKVLAETWARLGELQKAQGFAEKACRLGEDCDLSAYSNELTPEMTRHLFDQYAGTFEAHLQKLAYRVPAYLAGLLIPCLAGHERKIILDLGCGTGLMGGPLKPFASRLIGVDLSPKMLAEAARATHYDELIESDIVAYLESISYQPDLIVAADVLVYLGGLEDLMTAVGKVLAPGGLFAATIEFSADAPYKFTEARRYAHAPDYIEGLAKAEGMTVEAMQKIVPRLDRNQPVDGRMFLLRKN